jgi:hypothetical protein
MQDADGDTQIQVEESSDEDKIRFDTGGTERMIIDSTGVGIGNSSPSAQLQVGSGTDALSGTGTGQICLSGAGQTLAVTGKPAVYHRNGVGLGLYSDASMSFEINGSTSKTEAMRIDSSGNVGIGTSSPNGLITISSGAGTKATIETTRNFTVNRNFQIAVDEYAEGTFTITPSTALGGSTYTTPVITATAAGNVGIGTSSPSGKLDVRIGTCSQGAGLNIERSNTQAFEFFANSSANALYSEGNHGYFGTSTNHDLVYVTGGTERMRVDSSGRLLIGTTSALQTGNKLTVSGSATGAGDAVVDIRNTTTSDNPGAMSISKACTTTGNTNKYIHFFSSNFGVSHGTIATNGVGSMAFVSSSDERLKENIQPIKGSLDKVLALNPVSFDWKINGEHRKAGFVAQEVEKVLPEYVATDDDEIKTKNLTGSMADGYIAVLTKAIQEQQAQIEDLQSEINELKNS